MTDREAFEAWYCDQFGRLGAVNDMAKKLTYYADSHTHTAWTAWQAAAAAERERARNHSEKQQPKQVPAWVNAEYSRPWDELFPKKDHPI